MATFSVNTTAYEGRYLNLTINQVQNIEKNTSTLNWKLTVTGGKSKYYTVYPTTIKIAGVEVYNKEKTNWDTYQFPAAAGSVEGSVEVEHTSDGSKTIDVYFYTGVYYSSYQKDYGGRFTLDNIPRASSVAVGNYNLGQNIGITIGKKVNSFISTLTYKIGEQTGTITEKISDASYVWEMTDELISQIKQDNPTNKNVGATIYCETYSGDTKIGSTQSASFTLVITDKPTLTSISMNEVHSDIKQLTTAVLKYISVRNIEAKGIAPEGTTISNYKLKWGNIEKNSADGIFEIDNIQYSYLDENGDRKTKFTVVVTDERGNSSDGFFSVDEYPYICDFIEYVKLAFNNTDIKLTRLNGTSNYMKLHMTGYIYNGLIGETPNTLTLQYRYKLKNDTSAEWSKLKTIEATLNEDNTFEVDNLQLEDEFDYRENYDIEFYANDLFDSVMYSTVIKTSETVVKVHKSGLDAKNLTINYKQVLYEGTQENYSTEEQIIGTYRDKPLYRKVIFTTNGELQNEINSLNIDVLVNYQGWVVSEYDMIWSLPCYFFNTNEDTRYQMFIRKNISSGAYGVIKGDYMSDNLNCELTVEYTKTTDIVEEVNDEI